MNGLEKTRKKITESYERDIATLDLLDLIPECGVDFHTVGVGNAHTEDITYNTMLSAVRTIKRAGLDCVFGTYFYSSGLIVTYKIKSSDTTVNILFGISDADNALEIMSKGKCKIVSKEIEKTVTGVVCAVEED